MTEVQKWADAAMFRSETHKASDGPKVHILAAPADPLAQVSACAKMYKGEVVRNLREVAHKERVEYLAEMQKTKLAMPLEAINIHFMFENVTRGFTHQLVRQRTAGFAQESMRFAVVEDMTEAVALPPSLAGTLSKDEWISRQNAERPGVYSFDDELIEKYASKEQQARFKWDDTVSFIGDHYMELVNSGMPAEDARGLMPTNIVTRINYLTNFRGLLDHAGSRLCTQAQFEWKAVFARIAQALRNFNPYDAEIAAARNIGDEQSALFLEMLWDTNGRWQYEALADLLKPDCYLKGKCTFKADFDRKCSIRERVDMNAAAGRPSSEWGEETRANISQSGYTPVLIPAIHTREWLLDPSAAR